MHGAHVWFDHRENAGNIPPFTNLTLEEANHIGGILANLEFEGGPFNQESQETIPSMLRGRITQFLGHWTGKTFTTSLAIILSAASNTAGSMKLHSFEFALLGQQTHVCAICAQIHLDS